MPPAWPRLVLTAVLLLCAAYLVTDRMISISISDQERNDYFGSPAANRGEYLIYGLPPSPSESMPLLSIANAWLRNHVPPRIGAAAIGWAFCACAVLTFGLGCLLHSSLCGAVAVILLSRNLPPPTSSATAGSSS